MFFGEVESNGFARGDFFVPPLVSSIPKQPDFLHCSPLHPPPEMCDVLDDFGVASCRFAVVGGAGEGAGALEPRALHTHPFHFALFRLGKLCRYDDQAQIDHEKRADLGRKFTFCDGGKTELKKY